MKMKRFVAVLLVLLMVAAMVPIASAEETVAPGKSISATIDIAESDKDESVGGAAGTIKVKDGCNAVLTYVGPEDFLMFGFEPGMRSATVDSELGTEFEFTIQVGADAKPGEVITVEFNYILHDGSTESENYGFNSVSFIVEEQVTEPTDPDEPTDPEPTDPEPTIPVIPEEPSETVDYTELKKQIGIAESLVQGDYTAESWAKLAYALAAAKNALYSEDQDVVDAAAKALADAIAALVKMDYSKLEAAMASGEELAANDKVGNLWFELFKAIQEGVKLIGSGDQEAVDACTAKILDLIEQLKAALAETGAEPEEIIKEVIVEKDPEGDYCNITMHRIWPILFFISLALNVVFIVVIVVAVIRRKKNAKDDTPLVNYDIGDDA